MPPANDTAPAEGPRTILYTGKGGVGKTSVAAASARRCAAAGLRTVVISTDPAHSLADSLEAPLGPEPVRIEPELWAQEVQAQREMERNWAAVQDWLGRLLADRGVLGVAAEELCVPPGMDELFSLLEIKRHHRSGEFDVVIVDCAPTGETLRLLSFPDIARWWLDKVMPWESTLLAAARPIARTVFDVPVPGEEVLADVQRLVGNLIEMNEILGDHRRTSIRLVMNPDRMVIKEAQRTFTYLSLYGYLTDAVIVNRIFPAEAASGYFDAWRRGQAENLERVRSGFDPVPVLEARYFEREVMGPEMLDRLAAELYADHRPEEILCREIHQRLEERRGRTELSIRVPFAERSELELSKIGAELVVRAGQDKRTIILPDALRSHRPSGAKLEDGTLRIGFEREPDKQGDGAAASGEPEGTVEREGARA